MRLAFAAFAAALVLGSAAAAAQPVAPAPVAAAQPAEVGPEIALAEAALLRTIWKLQSGAPDYAAMEPKLADTVKAQPDLLKQVQAYGPARAVDYVGAVEGARHFKVAFAGVETHWFIALAPTGKIAALVFREA